MFRPVEKNYIPYVELCSEEAFNQFLEYANSDEWKTDLYLKKIGVNRSGERQKNV
jgi:hypothetical protein